MEYEGEEIDVPGLVPEFGAIFMSNLATKKECFRQKILALPSSMANFVKQVKEGMVLFLFEFEKRQLFGVYQATSDGGMNISSHPFVSLGKLFPAQVCFAPIWLCSPLYENEFRDAIRDNYFSSKKFHFGLSQDQVRHLLFLFSSRKLKDKLPPRQFSRIVTRSAGKDRRWADQGSFDTRERMEMKHCEDDLSPMGMSEFWENSPHRAIEADDNMRFIDNRAEYAKNIDPNADILLTDQAVDSLRKRKRVYDNGAETGLHDAYPPLLSYRMDNHEVSLDKERISATSGRFLNAENIENDHNIYASLSPGIATKYTDGPLDSTRRADYERPVFESANRHANYDDRFLRNDTLKNKLNSHSSFRYVISDKLEEDLERPGRAIESCELFMNSRLGHSNHMDDINSVVPSRNFDNCLHEVTGKPGERKLLMGERIATEHNLDKGLGFDFFSEKYRNPCDSDQSTIDEGRFLLGDKVVMKANYVDGIEGSTTSYNPSGHGTRIQRRPAGETLSPRRNRQDGGTFLGPVSTKYAAFSNLKQNSLDFTMSSQDNQLFQLKGLQNLKASNSTFHDSVVTRTIPSAPECTTVHRHSPSTEVNRGASLALDTTHYDCGGDLLDLSNRKSFERESSGRFDPASRLESKDFHLANHDFSRSHTGLVSQCLELRSSAPAVDTGFLLAPSTYGSVSLTESGDLFSFKKSPLVSDNQSMLPQEVQKRIHWRENDEKFVGSELLSSGPSGTGLGMYHRERHLTNDELECYKGYKIHMSNDYDYDQHCLNSGGSYSNSEKQRKSVFTRLTSGSGIRIQQEKEKDDAFCVDASVDEVMDMLNSCQNIRTNNLRFKSLVRQHDREETVRIEKQASPEQAKPRSSTTQTEDERSKIIEEGVDEMPKETREVEFKRRRDLKKFLDEDGSKTNVLRKEDNTCRENAESESPVNKQEKRRKLVRPVFGNNASIDAITGNQNLLSQTHCSQNKIQ